MTGPLRLCGHHGSAAQTSYDSLGRRTGLTRGNGTDSAYAYDDVSRLTGVSHNLSGTGSDVVLAFAHDPAGGIILHTRSNDAYSWGGHYAVNRSYTANGLNQYTAAGSVTPTYDARGNVTAAGSTTYSYNSENLLTSTSGSVTLAYDPATRLYETAGGSTARLAYDGQNAIAEYDGSNALQARYVFGPGGEPLVRYDVPNSSARYYYHEDERGSVIAQSDGSGAMASIDTYDEYGIPGAGNSGRFQYTGQQWLSGLGMQYSRARIYSPTLGRFMQTDPIGMNGGINIYGYVLNDPVNRVDPFGLQCRDIETWMVHVVQQVWQPGGPGPRKITDKWLETRSLCDNPLTTAGFDVGGGTDGGQNVVVTGPRRTFCRPQEGQIFDTPREAAEAGARFTYNNWRDAEPGDVRERGVRVGALGGGYSFGGLVYGPEDGRDVVIPNGLRDSGASHVHTMTLGSLSRGDRQAIERLREILGADTYFGLADRRGNVRTWGPGENLNGPGTRSAAGC